MNGPRPRVSITTAEIMDNLPSATDWRRHPLVRYLSVTSGAPPPLAFLIEEAAGKSASARSAGLFTLRNRYAATGMRTYVEALRDRSGEVNLLAAMAIAELGDRAHLEKFFDWAQRRISRKSRLNNWDVHELAALCLYFQRTDALSELSTLLRRYHRNLAPDEHAVLSQHAPELIDPQVDAADLVSSNIDIEGILRWANGASGTLFSDPDAELDPEEVEFAEHDIRELLKMK